MSLSTFDNLLDFTVDILAKRVPVENVNVKVDQIHQKIVLCEMPEGMYNKDTKQTTYVDQEDGSKVEEIIEHK